MWYQSPLGYQHVINTGHHVPSEEKCTDIIAFAAAEMADVLDGAHTSPCPVLSRLAKADPKKSDPRVV